ncbi:MAG: GIDE domain-containing protein [Elusimicrobiota bacterium]
MSNQFQSDVGAVFGAATGLWFFAQGFRRLKLKKLVEGTATSKVRSVAMGTVELFGSAREAASLPDPIFAKPCVYYRVLVEERRGSGKNARWETMFKQDSADQPFWLQDETGRILVLPSGAELYIEQDINQTLGGLPIFSRGAQDPVEEFARKAAGGWGTRRVQAWIIRPDEPVYVLGWACAASDPMTLREKAGRRMRELFLESVRRLKAEPARMKQLDLNGDGNVDAQEWDRGLEQCRRELEKDTSHSPETSKATDIIRKSPEGLLVLSDKPESKLVSHLLWAAFLKVAGGPILALACLAYLAQRCGLLDF